MYLKLVKNRIFWRILALSLLGLTISIPLGFINSGEEIKPVKGVMGGRSVILMIGDGMGHEHIKLGRWVEVGLEGQLGLDQLPFRLNVTTFNIDHQITDSAAAGTAIATGNKTDNALLSVSPSNETFRTILEIAKSNFMKSVGVVTTDSLTGGTPAAFMSHSLSRYNELGIARQIAEGQNIDVLLGGGKAYFTPYLDNFVTKGYSIVENKMGLEDSNSGKVLGLFSQTGMPEERIRNFNSTPSLAEMTSKAIEVLSQNPNGFFLMVEGAQIDWGAHANDKMYVALEMIEFAKAVKVATQYAESDNNTLLIVTADHETGGLSVISENMTDPLPSLGINDNEKRELRKSRVIDITVQWSSTDHTNASVPFYGYGDSFTNYINQSTIDNTDIFSMMKDYISTGSQQADGFVVVSLVLGFVILVPVQLFRSERKGKKKI